MVRRIFIGDVHGHYEGLMRLMDEIAPTSSDQIHFLGDLIDRGPQSKQVVEFVYSNSYPCVLGNHEQMLLQAFPDRHLSSVKMPVLMNWLYSGGESTLASYRNGAGHILQNLLQEHLAWMATLPNYLDLGDVWMVHAGVNPRRTLLEQTSDDLCWIRRGFHCSLEPYFEDKLIIIGHTITFTLPDVEPGQLAQGIGWIDIDTGAYHEKSGWLTGLDIDNQRVYQVNVLTHELRQRSLEDAIHQINPRQWLEAAR